MFLFLLCSLKSDLLLLFILELINFRLKSTLKDVFYIKKYYLCEYKIDLNKIQTTIILHIVWNEKKCEKNIKIKK